MRFRNSGRNAIESSSSARFVVMMISACRKSIVRPLASVTRPSSRSAAHRGDVGVRFLEFVEEHDAVRTAAHGFGELTRFVMPLISRRRAEQPRNRVRFGEFRKIDAHERLFGAEQRFRERFCEFGFADAAAIP